MAGFSQNALSCAASEPDQALHELPPFSALYREYFDFVWRTLQALGVGREALDDAVQDVFVVVHRRSTDFEGRATPKTWIFGIAYRIASNYRRSQRRRGPVEELSPEIASDAHNPQEAAQVGQALSFMHAFLDQLSEAKRAVFTACILEQMTAPEVADVLGCPLGTVYTRLRAVRGEFRQALARKAGERGAV